jgi:hypothetical protein
MNMGMKPLYLTKKKARKFTMMVQEARTTPFSLLGEQWWLLVY